LALLQWIVVLLFGAVALTALARRVGAPYPTFLAVAGAGIALLPFGPKLTLEPDLALALFVAPVLLDAAFDTSMRDLRENWVPIGLLVLVAVGLTTAAVAVVAHALVPDLPWAAAVVLGTIVAPPDAAAATAVLRQVRPPHRLLVILEGESLLNDASALFVYRLAVAAVVAGVPTPGDLALNFVLVVPGSLVAGWVLAHALLWLTTRLEYPPSAIVIQFASTFAVWILADRAGLSPVLTIVAYAVALARYAPQRHGARMRVPTYAVWETAVFLLNILAFVLIGLQVRPILDQLPAERLREYLGVAGAVLATVIVVRIAWVMAYNTGLRLKNHWFGLALPRPMLVPSARSGLVISWCGMRGIVTLAAALALPNGTEGTPAFPDRDLILLTAFAVVVGTLVLQGLTLPPLLRLFDLRDDDPVARETAHARIEVFRAALASLDGEEGPAAEALQREYKAVLKWAKAEPTATPGMTQVDELRLRTIGVARDVLFRLRSEGVIGDEAFHRVEEELDHAELHARPG